MPVTTAVLHGPDGPSVRITGAFDVATSSQVEAVLSGVLDDGHRSLSIDLAGVHFMDSTGLRVLNVARKRTDEAGGWITLRCLTPEVRRVLDLLGMVPYFKIVDDH